VIVGFQELEEGGVAQLEEAARPALLGHLALHAGQLRQLADAAMLHMRRYHVFHLQCFFEERQADILGTLRNIGNVEGTLRFKKRWKY
jgi:hypothetical protein